MFSENNISALNFPSIPNLKFRPKTLCLTFDDGPGDTVGDGSGPKTLRLAKFLNENGIRATFFSVGKFIEQHMQIVSEVDKLGHIIGNHTFSHPNMATLFENGGDCILEIRKTEELIRKCISDKPIYFRAPYGSWKAEISQLLNHNYENSKEYFGPFGWDIDASDWSLWNQGKGAVENACNYLKVILQKNSGIVLMHDCTADSDVMKANNKTFETIQIIIPILKMLDFKFIGLDEIVSLSQLA